MTLRLSLGAEADAADAIAWYNDQRDGLGVKFYEALERLLETIEAAPQRFPKVEGRNRRRTVKQALMRRFPYRVIFEVKDDQSLLVLAVAHTSRRPNYWRNRPGS
jgi:toxin ParE1/3/4